jgi:hypothetical protein
MTDYNFTPLAWHYALPVLGVFACLLLLQLGLSLVNDQLNQAPDDYDPAGFERLCAWMLNWIIILFLASLIAGAWLVAVRDSQLRPHRVTTSINGRVISSMMATNPAYVEWQTKEIVTTNGLEYRQVAVTNFYWHVWSMFK